MNDDKMNIPYIAFEGELARAERHIKRLWIVNIILILALILCNAAIERMRKAPEVSGA